MESRRVAGAVPVQLTSGALLLHPEEIVWRAMLDGWRNQQLSRNLAFSTIEQRESIISRFQRAVGSFPWEWTAPDVDEFFMELRAVRGASHTTLLGYQNSLRLFMGYVIDPAYGWAEECIRRFDDHPVQVCHEWNTARHVQEAGGRPGKRPYTRDELQDLFDCADERAVHARESGNKGWGAAFRTATIMKVAYAWGLRRNEVRQLDLVDFARNSAARTFGEYGILYVRHGKAMRGSPPKRRSVLTLPQFDWAVECLSEWIREIRPQFAPPAMTCLWPSERRGIITADAVSRAFTDVRREVELDEDLDFHSLRRSYVTHLIEDGFDAFFVQQQVGHENSSTTAIYTGVSPDYRNKVLQAALGKIIDEATTGTR